MCKKTLHILWGICGLFSFFLIIKSIIWLNFWQANVFSHSLEGIILAFIVIFLHLLVNGIISWARKEKSIREYVSKLDSTIVSQSHNPAFHSGDITSASRDLTRQVVETLKVNRCSIWLYNKNKTSIKCEQLYSFPERSWSFGATLQKNEFDPYFKALEKDPIIVANDAQNHPSTKCFKEDYLDPLGIKSMMDVPILFRGEVIGVICTESTQYRKWKEAEINFVKIFSSLFSFAYSGSRSESLRNDIIELENFLEETSIISKADKNGKITYVNSKFEEISGWKLEEVIGKDHKIVSSGEHTPEFWENMYKTVIKKKEIWHGLVTNKKKDGSIYYVDSYIKGEFDQDSGKFLGFMSIRQDFTDLVVGAMEIKKKNGYLEHAAKIIRHDMHSGINTYIPRGLSSLERRLSEEKAKELKIDAPLRMIKEGLRHTQKVYKGVYEFTNLVKQGAVLGVTECDLSYILSDYLSSTAYRPQVEILSLGTAQVNESLFCTAIDNLIRNGLKYNDSLDKKVKIYRQGDYLLIEDNGRGLSSEEFETLSKPYARKINQKESGSGLGLNICTSILKEHGFDIFCDKLPQGGTQIKINMKKS